MNPESVVLNVAALVPFVTCHCASILFEAPAALVVNVPLVICVVQPVAEPA